MFTKVGIEILKQTQILEDTIVVCASLPSSQVICDPSLVIIYHKDTQRVHILPTTVI